MNKCHLKIILFLFLMQTELGYSINRNLSDFCRENLGEEYKQECREADFSRENFCLNNPNLSCESISDLVILEWKAKFIAFRDHMEWQEKLNNRNIDVRFKEVTSIDDGKYWDFLNELCVDNLGESFRDNGCDYGFFILEIYCEIFPIEDCSLVSEDELEIWRQKFIETRDSFLMNEIRSLYLTPEYLKKQQMFCHQLTGIDVDCDVFDFSIDDYKKIKQLTGETIINTQMAFLHWKDSVIYQREMLLSKYQMEHPL